MKILHILLPLLFSSVFLSAQDSSSQPVDRTGKWIIEVGNGILTNIGGSPTGASVIFADGGTISNVAFNGGRFVSDNFAYKLNLGLFSFSSGFGGNSVINVMAGGKYYFGGIAPLDITAGVITGSGDTAFSGKATIGYAIALADNINLEPAAGVLFADDAGNGLFQVSFALFF